MTELDMFTIESDDEVDGIIPETDDESIEGMEFDFDTGDMDYGKRRNSRSSSSQKDANRTKQRVSDNEKILDEQNDMVRDMPLTEQRARLAAAKAMRRKQQEEAKSNGKRSKNAADDHDNDDEVEDEDEEVEEESDEDDAEEQEKEQEYYDEIIEQRTGEDEIVFSQLNLSRRLLRAIEAAGYVAATPVQAKVIPLALAGRDVCASAQTGSGKTAAFVLPFLERLLYRPRENAAIRVLVVTPTRELATQIHEVLVKLSQFTDITSILVCGGSKNVKSQAAVLRNRPDVVICTPGRIIDHLRNSPSVTIDELDVLVLDEVDRLMDLGFEAELDELVRFCPDKRQTMLFSATMTMKVENLARLSLRKPVRIKATPGRTNHAVAARLIQEFVRLRKPQEREAHLMALLCRSFKERVIAFFETKRAAHRFYLLLGMFGVRACELHGDLTQTQRYLALQRFREGQADVMIATDVAARGLDIPGVRAVLNADMPRSASTYVHRVGRTARAGTGGRSVTLVGDSRRKIMKEILKAGSVSTEDGGETISVDKNQVLNRVVPNAVVMHYLNKIAGLEEALVQEYKDEKGRKKLEEAEAAVERAENMIDYEDDIKSRPVRTWHQTKMERAATQEASLRQAKQEEKDAESGEKGSKKKRSGQWALPGQEEFFDDDAQRRKKLVKEKEKGKGLSREQRRRKAAMDAIAAEEAERRQMDDDDDDGHDENGGGRERHHASVTDKLNDSAKRKARRKDEEKKARESFFLQKDRETSKKRSRDEELLSVKKARPRRAVGGIDQDFNDWNGTVANGDKLNKKRRAEEEWKEYDPTANELRKGGKKGKHAFKSKAKYKRRK